MHRRWAGPMVALALIGSLGACQDKDPRPPSAEQQKFDALRADPVLNVEIPGANAEPIVGNPGHAGQNPTPTQAFRYWNVPATDDKTFIDAVKRFVAAGLRVDAVTCGPTRIASGVKLVGGYVVGVTVGLGPSAGGKLQAMVTTAGGADAPRGPLPPPNRSVDPGCPEPVKALVSAG